MGLFRTILGYEIFFSEGTGAIMENLKRPTVVHPVSGLGWEGPPSPEMFLYHPGADRSELSMYRCIHLSCVIGSRGEITVMTFHLKHGHPKHPTCPIFSMSFVTKSRQKKKKKKRVDKPYFLRIQLQE